jgi:hypothetical protein
VEATASMEMAPGELPCPDRVPEQRLLSPKIHRWRRRSCKTLSRKTPTPLGFFVGRLYIGREAASGSGLGGSPPSGAARREARHPRCGGPLAPSPALLRSSSFVREK